MVEIQEYLDEDGVSSFSQWFESLDTQAALKVTTYLARLENGNTSALKSLGKGLWEPFSAALTSGEDNKFNKLQGILPPQPIWSIAL